MTITILPDGTTEFDITINEQTVFVGDGIVRDTADRRGINGNAYDHTTTIVDGFVRGASSGYLSGATALTFSPTLIVGATGAVTGGIGALAYGSDVFVSNAGRIEGVASEGIEFNGTGGSLVNSGTVKGVTFGVSGNGIALDIQNSGKILGGTNGILSIGTAAEDGLNLVNSGLVRGDIGIRMNSTGEDDSVTNTGTIEGRGGTAIEGNDDRQVILNEGKIKGNVLLEGHEDVYISLKGKVEGYVDGGTGNDFLRGGKSNDDLRGGDGNDTLVGRDGNDKLDGGASNDTINGGNGNDKINGGSGFDSLEGRKGNDKIKGGDNNDDIEGGRGNDVQWGGSGFDDFIFKGRTDKDKIKDFETGIDDIDLSAYNISNTNKFLKKAIDTKKGDSIIDLDYVGGKGEIVVENVTNLDAFDFIF